MKIYLLFADLGKTNLQQFFTVSKMLTAAKTFEEYIFHFSPDILTWREALAIIQKQNHFTRTQQNLRKHKNLVVLENY